MRIYSDEECEGKRKILSGKTGEEKLEEAIAWINGLPIDEELKMEIEAKMRSNFKLDPTILNKTEEVEFRPMELEYDEDEEF